MGTGVPVTPRSLAVWLRGAIIGFFQRLPWFGWAVWLLVCTILVVQAAPRRIGSTFNVYFETARLFAAEQPLYDPERIDNFLYWPVSLLLYRPLVACEAITAARIVLALSVALLSLACVQLMQALLGSPPYWRGGEPGPRPHARLAVALAGTLLLINLPAAWFNLKSVQAQVAMTAGMLLAAAAMMRGSFRLAAAWLFFAAVVKPLALVMLLLCAALERRMRLALAAALIACILLPFLFADPSYVAEQYRLWLRKLWSLANVAPRDWPYQADIQTLLDGLGIILPRSVMLAIRLIAALGTLALAWRVAAVASRREFGLAVLLLAGCYITLFGPRNEFLSFLVLTPALAALALLLLLQNPGDRRGWLLILAALLLGMVWALAVDRVLKPAIVVFVYGWLAWLMVTPQRWQKLLAEPSPAR